MSLSEIVTETSYQMLEVKYHLAITLRSLEACECSIVSIFLHIHGLFHSFSKKVTSSNFVTRQS